MGWLASFVTADESMVPRKGIVVLTLKVFGDDQAAHIFSG